MERRNGPQSSFRGFRPSPAREGWFPLSGYLVVFLEVALIGEMLWLCANPTLEQMDRHWFYSFGTNPSAESFVQSRAHF
jgi:hypothetical protein